MMIAGREVPVRIASGAGDRATFFPSVGEYPAYDDGVYDTFAVPGQRNAAYLRAIAAHSVGKTVLDIGTGRDALWAVAAARAGAAKVYAIEADATAAAHARGAVARSGVSDIVTVIDGDSRDISLPEPAGVCISEIVGNISSAEGLICVLADAAQRLCDRDCSWIPYECETQVAAVNLQPHLGDAGYAIAEASLPYLERVYETLGYPFDVRMCAAGPVSDAVISSTQALETIRCDGSTATDSMHEVTVTMSATDLLTGFVLWPMIRCAPHDPAVDGLMLTERAWAPVYVPVSLAGVPVSRGDTADFHFNRSLSDDRVHPDYRLHVRIRRAGQSTISADWMSSHHDPRFRATEFYRALFPEALNPA
jgi:protein arginine N-methyltransferase 1